MNKNNQSTTLGGDAIRLTGSKIITLVITMLTTMLLSRFRTKTEYGTYSQLLLVINLFTSLLMLGLPNSINYFLARAETQEERQRFLSVYYTLSTALSILIGALLVVSVPLIEAYFHNTLIRGFWYFLALYPWAHIISASIENLLVVYKKTRFLMAYRVVHSAALLGSVLIVQWLGYGFTAYMIAFIVINCLFCLSVYFIAGRLSGGIRFLFDQSLIRTVFTFSIPIGLAAVVGTLNAEIDKLLIGYLMDTEQLAIYTNAAKELPIAIVASSITAVLLPQLTRMVKNNRSLEAMKLWGYATELAYAIIALIVAGVFVYAEEAMTILYSEKYLPGVDVFRVYTLNLLLRCTYFGIVLNAFGKTKKIFFCSLISLGLNIILNPLFYWIFGMIGPAIATFLAIFLVLLLQLKMTSKITNIAFCKVFPWRSIMLLTLLNASMALVFWSIKKLLPLEMLIGEIGESLALGALWTVIYLFVMKKYLLSKWHDLNRKGEDE